MYSWKKRGLSGFKQTFSEVIKTFLRPITKRKRPYLRIYLTNWLSLIIINISVRSMLWNFWKILKPVRHSFIKSIWRWIIMSKQLICQAPHKLENQLNRITYSFTTIFMPFICLIKLNRSRRHFFWPMIVAKTLANYSIVAVVISKESKGVLRSCQLKENLN